MSEVDQIKHQIDIVDLVSEYVQLNKTGQNFKALCPFHTEKTPSFIVNPERQSWRCFGACSTGGDIFSFVMRSENLDFGTTVRLLAQKTGITIPERRNSNSLDSLFQINQVAVEFYKTALMSSRGNQGIQYLDQRGVDEESMVNFELGLSPEGSENLKNHLLSLGLDVDHAITAGLLRRTENGTVYDFFWNRLMFPIFNQNNQAIGFGGRSLDNSEPKYINTASTPIFNKRSVLYGLNLAKADINKQKTVVVVEGYMDVIAAHQHGYKNVVASMGTAITEHQVSQLKSIAHQFVQALDPDNAGKEATVKSLESSWRVFERNTIGTGRRSIGQLYQREPLELKIASLPSGNDPDTLIRHNEKEWQHIIKNAEPFMDYILPAFASRYDLSSDSGKAQAAEVLLPLVTGTGNAFEQERYFRKLAEVLGVTTEALQASVVRLKPRQQFRNRLTDQNQQTQSTTKSALSKTAKYSVEDYLLALLLHKPEIRNQVTLPTPERFQKVENREVFTLWQDCNKIEELIAHADPSLHGHIEYLLEIDIILSNTSATLMALNQLINRLEKLHIQELQELILISGDETSVPPTELEHEIVRLNTRLKELS